MRTPALLLCALAAATAVAASAWPHAAAVPAAIPAAVPAAAAPVSTPAVAATTAVSPPAAPAPSPPAAVATYPDGSTRPLLNGVREAVTVQWPANRPFSPIVATVTDEHGIGWYRHQDGTWSTVRMLHDSARNLDVATSQVFSPMPVKDHPTLRKPSGG